MKKLLVAILFLTATCHAGTVTTNFGTAGGSVIFSSRTASVIAYDTATISNLASVASPCTWSITLGLGSALGNKVAILSCTGVNVTVSAATLGGNAFSLAKKNTNSNSLVHTEIWYLTHSMTGAQTISVTPTAGSCGGITSNMICTVSNWTGVDQTNPIEVSTGATSNATSVSVSSDVIYIGDLLVDAVGLATTSNAIVAGTSQASMANIPNTNQGITAGMSYKGPQSAAGTQTMSWSYGGAGARWTETWVGLRQAQPY